MVHMLKKSISLRYICCQFAQTLPKILFVAFFTSTVEASTSCGASYTSSAKHTPSISTLFSTANTLVRENDLLRVETVGSGPDAVTIVTEKRPLTRHQRFFPMGLTLKSTYKIQGLLHRLGFRTVSPGVTLRPGNAAAMNRNLDKLQETLPNELQSQIRFVDDFSPGIQDPLGFISNFTRSELMPAARSDIETSLHDFATHAVAMAVLPPKVSQHARHNFDIFIELANSPPFKDTPQQEKIIAALDSTLEFKTTFASTFLLSPNGRPMVVIRSWNEVINPIEGILSEFTSEQLKALEQVQDQLLPGISQSEGQVLFEVGRRYFLDP